MSNKSAVAGAFGEVGDEGGVGDLAFKAFCVDDLARKALKGVVFMIEAIVGEALIFCCLSTLVLFLLVSRLSKDLNFSVSFLKSIPE